MCALVTGVKTCALPILTRSVAVSANGSYNIASLPVGTYRLELTTPDGVRRTDEFTLTVGQNAVLDFDFSAPDIAAGEGDAIIVTGSRIKPMEGGEEIGRASCRARVCPDVAILLVAETLKYKTQEPSR